MVDFAPGRVAGDHGPAADLQYAGGDHVDVGLRERGIRLVREQGPLAADLEVWCELGPKLGVADLAA